MTKKTLITNDNPQIERAIVVLVASYADSAYQQEFLDLVTSTGTVVVADMVVNLNTIVPSTYITRGKLAELVELLEQNPAEVVIFSCHLSPSQERNLTNALKVKVLARTNVILDIFAQRARTYEGKLQVELAQLQHMSTRLIRGWTHLERQKGGIGLRGPGETQLETDRRLLRERIKSIHKSLDKVQKQRIQSRSARIASEIPIVSLVGYTNAGKSTLFNSLTSADIYAADQLFATLDTTARQLELPHGAPAILTDTVGFMRDLPHQLIKAFHATLEEICHADILLHVVDVSAKNHQLLMSEVNSVLTEIGAGNIPQIIVFNQIDNLSGEIDIVADESVWISAKNGTGLERLLDVIHEKLYGQILYREFIINSHDGKKRAKLYQYTQVLREETLPDGSYLLCVEGSQKILDSFE